jgi:hypothetical protein
MTRLQTGWLAVIGVLVSAGAVPAHHSLANFDTTTAVRVKGTVFQVHLMNPHSFIFVDQADAGGQVRRWAVEGPSLLQLRRRGLADDMLKPGDVVEACGYAPKEATVWQIAAGPGAVSPSGRLLTGEMLVMPDGGVQSWGDYGVHRCFPPEYSDQHSK